MNRTYRLVWSDASQSYVPVPESARARGKRKAIDIGGAVLALLGLAGPAFPLAPDALPTGGQVVGGQATISQAGSALTIQQTSSRAAIDWQSFNIGAKASVTFHQPSAAAIALNRVVGQDPSQILGSLSADGQVFIVNPSGVLFGRGAQVNAQGLLASTRDISVAGFMDGKDVFSGAGTGRVVNEGTLQAGPGGYVALIGAQVKNLGEIHAPQGDVRLAAADRVTVTLDNGSLAGFTVERGTLDALAQNGGLIKAEGGRVYLTADAADRLAKAVVNHTGVIEARGVENRDGTIVLLADLNVGTANVAGTLDASRSDGAKGGFIETSGHTVNIADGATVKAGRWLIDPADFTIAASGGNMTGAAATAALAAGDLEIQSATGSGGGNGDIHVNDAVSWSANTLTLTAARDININAVMTASGSSKLVMNTGTANGADAGVAGGTVKVGFNSNGTFKGRVDFPGRTGTGFLTINGEGYTVINSLGAEGSATGSDLQGMQGATAGRYAMGGDIDASASASWTLNFKPVYLYGKFDGLGHTITNLVTRPSIPRYVGLFAKVSSTAAVANVGLVGGSLHGDRYLGLLAGQNDGTITNSYATGSIISLYPGGPNPWGFDVGGLVGINNGTITGSHAAVTVQAHETIGGLVGRNNGTISNSYATGNISTYDPYDDSIWGLQAGGLAGVNSGTITTSFATGNVDALDAAGGLVGVNGGSISTSYATGNVTGSPVRIEFYIWPIGTGGLVGYHGGSISNCYAAGTVSKYETVSGLVGFNDGGLIANSFSNAVVIGTNKAGLVGGSSGSTYLVNSFWNTDTSGIPALPEWSYWSAGIGKTTEQMQQLATYAGWDIAATGGSGAIWRIYEGQTTPLLRSFLTPMTVTATSGSRTYDGTTNGIGVSHSPTPGAGLLLGSATTTADSKNVGTWTVTASGLYSTQQGYDIAYVSGTVDITPKTVTVSGITAASKVYDGSTAATVSTAGASFSGLVAGDDLTVAATGSFADKNAGNGKTVNLASAYGGADIGNYAITGQATATAAITPKALTVSGVTAADKVYDGTTTATVSTDGASFSGLVAGDALTATGAFTNKNAGTGKTVNLAYGGADAGNYAITGQTTTTAAITRRIVTVFGITAAGKVYDGSTAATVSTAGAAFSGLVAGDDLTVAATGSFADKNAGTGKAVDLASIYGGADIGNYSIRGQGTATATITPKAVTLSGITAADKVYDGNTSAAVNAGGAVLSGVVAGDDLTFTSFGGTFANKNAGAGKTVNLLNSYSGVDLGNYAITDQGTATASITPKALTVSGLTASNKVYDGNTAATVSTAGATFSGLVAGDDVTSTGVFADKNVGSGKTVSLTYGGADMGNYTISGQSTATASITPKTVTLSGITAADKVYDGNTSATVNASGAVLNGLVAGDDLTVTSFGGTFASKNVGTGKTVNLLNSYSGVDLGNYVITDQGTATARITPKALTVSGIAASDKVYDGNTAATVSTAGAVYTGLVAGDNLTVAATGSFADKNAGSGKTVTLISTYGGADAGNYAIAGQAGTTAAITPKALTVSGLTATDKVYDGTTAATVSTAGATFGGLVAGDNLTATGSFANKNAGAGKTVNLAYGGADAGNYAISGQGTATASITPKAVTLSGITAADKVYDGSTAATVSTTGASFSGLVAGDDLTVAATGAFANKNAGNGKAVNLASTYGGADLGNYAITGQASTTAAITPKALTVSGLTAADKVYDGSIAATVSTAGATFSGLVAGDNLTVAATGAFADKNAGNGKTVNLASTYGGADAGNYAITGQASTTAAITPKALTVTGLTASDKVYDGTTAATVSTAAAAFNGLVAGDHFTVAATGAFADKNAGTGKTVSLVSTYGGADAGNYAITGQANTTASITPKALTVVGITASNKVYDGSTATTVSTAAAAFNGLVAGDAFTVAATGSFADKNAGTGKTVSLASTYGGADAGNYAIAGQAGTTAAITPKAVTLSGLTASDKVYDGTTNATVSTAGATFGGLVAGDALTVAATGRFADKHAGAGKTVTLASTYGGADLGNYAITGQASTTAAITPKALTVSGLTASDKVYDGTTAATISTAAAAFNGLVAGDNLTVAATGSFTDKNAGAGKTVNLASTYGGADAGNYAITGQASTTAAITPKALAVSGITAGDKVYDGTTAATVSTVSTAGAGFSGLVAGDALTVAATGAFADKNTGTGKTVTLVSSYGGADVGNYAITGQASTTAAITPKALTVSGLTAADKVYDGTTAATVSTAGAAFNGLVAGDALTATGTFTDKNAGPGKTVNLAYGGADSRNYAISGQRTATADITPRGLTVALTGPVIKAADGTVNATLASANYTVGNVIAGESVSVTQTAGRYDDAAPGAKRTVTATLSAENYAAGAGTFLSNYRPVAGPVVGPVGEILTSTPSAAYTGALSTASARPPATGNTPLSPISVPAPASVPQNPAASTVVLANAHGLPLTTLHIVDGGLRLPNPLSSQE